MMNMHSVLCHAAFMLISMPSTVGAMANGVARTPPLGWSTWETCADKLCTHDVCTESEVLAVADAMVMRGLRKAGWEYVNLDDCWAGATRTVNGSLTWDIGRFPSGIPSLADELHARGLKLGVYTSAGHTTCHGRLPGSRDHYAEDARTFASWGVDYIKFDWCGDIKKELWLGRRAHLEFAAAINQSGRPMALEVVAGYFFLGEEIRSAANVWRFCLDHHDTFKSTVEAIACRLDLSGKAVGAPGGWPSMDLLTTGGAGCQTASHCPGQSEAAYETEFALWALTQSPLLIATDLRNMTKQMAALMLNAELIAIHQLTATPPGRHLATWACTEPLKCSIWGRELHRNGTEWLVGLVNLGSRKHTIVAAWALLGWSPTVRAHVRDVLAGQVLLNETSTEVSLQVDPQGTRLIRLRHL